MIEGPLIPIVVVVILYWTTGLLVRSRPERD